MGEFQECIHLLNRESCPTAPCKSSSTATAHDGACHTAEHGDDCFSEVMKAISDGTLHSADTFEGVQEALHHSGIKACPLPCKCETAEPESECFKHVQWALKGGIREHPFWYMGLSEDSTFTDVQEYLYKKHSCPPPCRAISKASSTESSQSGYRSGFSGSPSTEQAEEDACRVAKPDELCYTNVLYGMRRGLSEHPEWYPGLDQFSSFEEFQGILHRNPDLNCPRPCACKTAKK